MHLLKKISETKFKGNKNKIKQGIYTFVNPYSYLIARKKPELFNDFDGVFADGTLFVFLFNLFFPKLRINRVSFDMTSLGKEILMFSNQNNKKIFFIGAKEHEIKATINILKKKFSELNICGYRNGYLNSEDEKINVYKNLLEINPDIVVVGMGTPLQEEFLSGLKGMGWKGTGFTCGGFLHQTANKLYYYPKIINKLNLRWLYRLIREPYSRKRFFKIYPIFPFIFLYDVILYRLTK